MKRHGSSDSVGAIISMCPTSEEHSPASNNHIYSRGEYQSMLELGFDEEGSMEEFGPVLEKKRRLSVTQVKALEKSFDVDNKLEPETKLKLAQELCLQPRQVAVWFQNRRARWKTKQLERDYGALLSNFDDLKKNYDFLQRDKDDLLNEIKELKSKLKEEENRESNMPIKEEANSGSESENKPLEHMSEDANLGVITGKNIVELYKDGQSDSDSSAILNDHQSPNSSSGFLESQPKRFNSSSLSPTSSFEVYNPELVKMEEHNFFGDEEETCDFFTDEQAPTLQWCWT